MRRSRRVKIVATLGPASNAPEMIERLFEAGVDVFRINMSHTSFDVVRKLHAAVRTAEAQFGRPIGILADLQGPKFRIGEIGGGSASLDPGATFVFDTTESPGSAARAFLPHPADLRCRRGGPYPAARRRQDPHDGGLQDADAHRGHAWWWAGPSPAARASACPTPCLPIGPLTDKDRADLDYVLRLGRRLGGAVVRAARRGHAAGAPDRRPGRRADGQDREAGGDRRPRFHRRRLRRPDGGARRPRRRDAGGARARPAESRSSASRAPRASPWWWLRRCWRA